MEKLIEITKQYCEQRNLDQECYIEGMLSKGPLSDKTIKSLIQNHRRWMQGKW